MVVRLEVFEVAAHLFNPSPVAFGIAVIKKILITAVNALHAKSVLDRTPILFRPRGDFGCKGENAVGIAAIFAIQFFDKIEIREPPAVEQDEVRAPRLGNAVDRETHRLVDRQHQIEKTDRQKTKPDQGGREKHQALGISKEPGKAFQEMLLAKFGRFGEVNLPFANLIIKLLLLTLKFSQQVLFGLAEFREYLLEAVNYASMAARVGGRRCCCGRLGRRIRDS